jgi:hypothetical protein
MVRLRPEQTENVLTAPAAIAPRQWAVSATWLLLWLAAAAWLVWRLATNWPYSGTYAQLGLVLAAAGMLYRSFSLAYLWRARRPLAGWRHWLARVLTLPLGIVLAASAWDGLAAHSLHRFEAAMAGWVAQVAKQMPNPCPPAARYTFDANLADYVTQARQSPAAPGSVKATLHHDDRQFVLSFIGGSIDFDGSTVFHDSARGTWSIFHNDIRASVDAFEARTKGMQICRIALP